MRHLVLRGSPYERGFLHGKTWAREIHEFAAIRKELLVKSSTRLSERALAKLVEAHLVVLKNDPELWEEFSGISKGASLSEQDLMILNNHTDLRDFERGDTNESFFECSCFAFLNDGRILAGQTWDMHASAKPYVAHLTIHKENEVQEVFTLTGCLGLTGVSSRSSGVFINNLRSRELKVGYAWPALVRKLLNCSSLTEAEKILRAHMPSGGRNFMLVDKTEAANFEVTGLQVEVESKLSTKSFLYHTNHYLSSLKTTEEESTRSQTTYKRYEYLGRVIPTLAEQNLNVEKIGEELLNKGLDIVCLPPPRDPHGSATCGGLLYDFGKKSGLSFEGLYSENNHLKL